MTCAEAINRWADAMFKAQIATLALLVVLVLVLFVIALVVILRAMVNAGH